MRSFAFVVVAGPLLIAAVMPVLTWLTSNGFTLSMPEYSWMYMSAPQAVMAVAKVARTVFAPPAMFFA